ncbi:MAG: DUF4410 domain-containing protein [Vicinamibacteraceae bacterium]
MSHIVRWTAAFVLALPGTVHFATGSPALASPMPELSGVQAEAPVKTIEDGALDEITLYTEAAPRAAPVYVELFDASKADIGTGNEEEDEKAEADRMKAEAPRLIAQAIVDALKETSSFPSVTLADEKGETRDGLVITGEVTALDPGSRKLRAFAGFGAGKSTVAVKAAIKDAASGKVLATFVHTHHGRGGWGGGDSIELMTGDSKNLGEDIADFLHRWTTGDDID